MMGLIFTTYSININVDIMCQLFKYFGLYEEDGAGHGFYCVYELNFEEGDFHF